MHAAFSASAVSGFYHVPSDCFFGIIPVMRLVTRAWKPSKVLKLAGERHPDSLLKRSTACTAAL